MKYAICYTLCGALVGLCFPLGATLTDSILQFGSIDLAHLAILQRTNPLHWIIDTAPLVLGFLASQVGRRQDALVAIMDNLSSLVEERTRELEARNQEVQKAKNYTDKIIDSMSDCLFVTAADGTIRRTNGAATALLGYPADELIDHPLGAILENEQVELIDQLCREGMIGQLENTCLSRSGDKVPMVFSGSVLYNATGVVQALVFVGRDATLQKQSEDYLRGIIDASPVGSLVVNQEGRIDSANQALAEIFGYCTEEITGQPVEFLVPERFHSRHVDHRQAFEKNGESRAMSADTDVVGIRKDGTEFPALVTLSSTQLQGHNIVLAGVIDRTQHYEAEAIRRRMEADIARSAGMAEVATEVLHNVGNVVNSVNISAGIARDRLRKTSLDLMERVIGLLDEHAADPASLTKFLSEDPRGTRLAESQRKIATRLRQEHSAILTELVTMQEHVGHIIAIVSSQQEFASATATTEDIALGPFLDRAIVLCGNGFNCEDITVERSFADVQTLSVEPHKLMQIVINLLSNARQALVENDPGDRLIKVQVKRNGNDTVLISVSDNGIGIPAENLARIFTHGFTTKADGHGFGLHISANTAVELGGNLRVHSEGPGKGSTFQIALPA